MRLLDKNCIKRWQISYGRVWWSSIAYWSFYNC